MHVANGSSALLLPPLGSSHPTIGESRGPLGSSTRIRVASRRARVRVGLRWRQDCRLDADACYDNLIIVTRPCLPMWDSAMSGRPCDGNRSQRPSATTPTQRQGKRGKCTTRGPGAGPARSCPCELRDLCGVDADADEHTGWATSSYDPASSDGALGRLHVIDTVIARAWRHSAACRRPLRTYPLSRGRPNRLWPRA